MHAFRKALAFVGLLVICACGATSTKSVAVSPSASSPTPASVSAYAVLVNNFMNFSDGGIPDYTLSIVAADGHVAASATARNRATLGVQIANLSTSATTVYFLDGDADVRFLHPDGSTGLATHITLDSKQAAAFAVSPDDRRIAVSVLDYTRYPVSTRLYVEDLHGGGNHVELLSSSNLMEWPVGWHSGNLVMALGLNIPPQNSGDWFQGAHGYQIVDAQSGKPLHSLCDGEDSFVPASPVGAVCVNFPTASVTSWDGLTRALPTALKPDATSGTCSLSGPLSPAGVVATDIVSVSLGGCGGGTTVFTVSALGAIDPRAVATKALPVGWTDSDHLVVDAALWTRPQAQQDLSIVDVRTLAVAHVQAAGFFAAALPGGL